MGLGVRFGVPTRVRFLLQPESKSSSWSTTSNYMESIDEARYHEHQKTQNAQMAQKHKGGSVLSFVPFAWILTPAALRPNLRERRLRFGFWYSLSSLRCRG